MSVVSSFEDGNKCSKISVFCKHICLLNFTTLVFLEFCRFVTKYQLLRMKKAPSGGT